MIKEERKSRNHDIKVKFDKEEKRRLKVKAEELGIKLSTYIRMVSLNAKVYLR